MDFSRIQASGVSKLLLKGQQYSAPPNMNRIHVLDKWRFAGYTPFLDATMFLLAKGGRIIDTVDFSHTRSIGTSVVGAVSHSGDMMDESSSTHTIDVQLSNLGNFPLNCLLAPDLAEPWSEYAIPSICASHKDQKVL